jgi:DNA processing protein
MNKIYSIWLSELNLKDTLKFKLYLYFGSCEGVFKAEQKSYFCVGLSPKEVDKLIQHKKHLPKSHEIYNRCMQEDILILTIEDKNYPFLLKQIVDPPIVLYVLGEPSLLCRPSLGVVGARKCSEYGFWMAKKLASELSEVGMLVVSGMATGIDEAAHRGALQEGPSVGVLGTGVDVCYPKNNWKIYKELVAKGCLVSTYPPGTPPLPFRFPERNRIISGLSIGILVVEAAPKSGSLITAALALEQNREVFAVPGNATSTLSEGVNKLIQEGAKLVINKEDILDEIPLYITQKIPLFKKNTNLQEKLLLDKLEIMVYDCLSWQGDALQKIVKNSKLSIDEVTTTLLKLEIKGWAQRLPANRYVRVK